MISKQDLQILMQCVDACKVNPDAMIAVGIAYRNAKNAVAKMSDTQILILDGEKKSAQPGESVEQSQLKAELKPVPKKGK